MKIGIDLEKVERFYKLSPGSALVKRCFTPAEARECFAKPRPAESLAARFAAKEAYFKAAGPCDYRHAEFLNSPRGLAVRLNGRLARRIHASVTHTKTDAAAIVVIE